MKPRSRSSIFAAAIAGLAITTLSATAQVVFSESFEAPVVSGFDDNTIPSGGNWIGSSGAFNASLRGLYNESVVWPATPPFTTPYGQQGYSLNYSTTMLTTAQGATGLTITADVTYTLTFQTAKVQGTSADYLAHLVAFGPADDNSTRQNPNSLAGTIVAQATGAINASDMSDSVTIVFTPDAENPHLGKELGIRFDKASNGNAIYDNVRLIVGHDLNPDPANGEDLSVGGNVTLNWTNIPPNAPATETPVDVWFGNTSGALSQVVDGQIISSTIVNAPGAGTWYWRVDSYPDGDPNGTPVVGQEFSFTIADTDGDGIPDTWEQQYFGGPTAADAGLDSDTDGLSNLDEYIRSTNPSVADTDDDGLLDGVESATGTWVSASNTGTLPLVADTDADGLLDGVETNTGTWVSAADTGTSPVDNDWDKDGLLDGAETNTGTLVDKTNTGTNPYLSDTDADGAGDYYEVYASFTSPFDNTDKPFVPYPLPDPDGSPGATDKPVKVFICSGQSNMVGIGNVYGTGAGTLETITKRQNKFPNLLDESNAWTARQDVRYRGVISATANGPLTAGQGADANKLGPELGFGHVMGWYLDEPVLVLKSSIGNRSLGWDILPAGSQSYQYEGNNYAGYGGGDLKWAIGETEVPWSPGGWYAGYEWDRYFLDESEWAHPHASEPTVTNVVDILDNWVAEYSGTGKPFAGQDFEIAGFVWWQGDKDRGDIGHATRYEQNLVNLIQSLRSYYGNRYPGKGAISAPFVLATLGQTALGDTTPATDVAILDAHMAVDGEAGNYAQFAGNVKTVYAHPLSQGGASNNHYDENAETYMLVGDALGRAMIDLLQAADGPDETPPVAVSLNPSNGASGVSAGVNLAITFNELIAKGTGNITLRNLPDDGPTGDVVIDVTDASQVTVSSNTLTIDPTVVLATSTQYAVLIDATAIADLAGNSYAGIADDTTWSFTTATPDTVDPTLSSTVPVNGATVTAITNLEATFSEPIAIGAGNITLKNLTDGPGGDVVIAVTDGSQVSVSGSVLTINPTADLLLGKDYAVWIDATAIDDLVGNSFAGIGNDTTWFFSTPAPPPPNVVFFDDFEAGGNPSALPATSGGYSNTPDVTTYTVDNTSGEANSSLWVRANQGFNGSRNGLIDESENGGANFTDPVGSQAYGFRYSNSGVTTAQGVIGSLTAGTTITVSFDVFVDGFNAGNNYIVYLATFNGGRRNDIDAGGFTQGTTAVLASASGTAASGAYQRVSFSYTVGDNVLDANGETTGAPTAFDPALLGHDIAVRFDGATNSANWDNVQVAITGGGDGPGPVASFEISPIASPQTVGTPITGITITAKDASNATATGFTGTVTFSGSGGFSGTSANFVDGVLSGASVTPTVAGSNLTLVVTDSAGPSTGSTSIATIRSTYDAWSGDLPFDGDANGDGIANGMAWVLGAADPTANANGLLPEPAEGAGGLTLSFRARNAASRSGAVLQVQYSGDLGNGAEWVSVTVPDTSGTVGGLEFTITADGDFNDVMVTIPAGAAQDGALFGRLLLVE